MNTFTRRELLQSGTLAATALLAPAFVHAATGDVIATTRSGHIRGSREHGVHVFRGIPYGADTATRRFRPAMTPVA